MKRFILVMIINGCGLFSTSLSAQSKEKDDVEESSTKFDFDEATLEGKMKAPSGMMLKGRVEQNKNQMVQLRKNFRSDLQKGGAAVRAIKPRE